MRRVIVFPLMIFPLVISPLVTRDYVVSTSAFGKADFWLYPLLLCLREVVDPRYALTRTFPKTVHQMEQFS